MVKLNREHEIRAYERAINAAVIDRVATSEGWRYVRDDVEARVARKARSEAICGLCRVLDAKGDEIRLDTPSACTCFYDANLGRLVRCGLETCRHGRG